MSFTSRFVVIRRRTSVVLAASVMAIVGLNAITPADAQTTPVDLVFVLPAGSNAAQLPLGAQSFQLQVKNTSAAPLTNLQVVLRVPPSPAYVVSVSDGTSPFGLIDNRSGFWYATLAQVNATSSVTLAVTWQTPCPGKWPITARVGTQKAAIAPTWIGAPNSQCGPDENASPAPASYYELPWPPSVIGGSTISGSTTTAGPTTTVFGQVVATAPTTILGGGVVGPTSSTLLSLLATSTTANIQPIGQVTSTTIPLSASPTTAPTSTTKAALVTPPTTAPVLVAPTTTEALVEISPDTTATTPKKSSRVTKTGSKANAKTSTKTSTATTVVTICKTIGGKRYCGPASSVYKPGQKKAIQSTPKTVSKTKTGAKAKTVTKTSTVTKP